MTARLSLANQPWLADTDLQHLLAVLAAVGAEGRVVGGAVRNALLGLPVADIDLAVNRPPEQTETILQQAGIKTVCTGFAHGTITAILNGRGYEITSLRVDVTTDGRHASVAYGDDWGQDSASDKWARDAARRDFTMNALYAAADGTIYDYHDGLADIRAGTVRFIGDAAARIAEDFLRVLRFFRFHAYYGRGEMDVAGLAACAHAAPKLNRLSRERVTQEWRKILVADAPMAVLRAMQHAQILPRIVPLQLDLPQLERLLSLPLGAESGFAVRMAALLPQDKQLSNVLQAALRLSNAELGQIMALMQAQARAEPLARSVLPELLYYHGQNFVRDLLRLHFAKGIAEHTVTTDATEMMMLNDLIVGWQKPIFPLSGDDLIRLGMPPSPAMGDILRHVERWWLDAATLPSHQECLAQAKLLWQDKPNHHA